MKEVTQMWEKSRQGNYQKINWEIIPTHWKSVSPTCECDLLCQITLPQLPLLHFEKVKSVLILICLLPLCPSSCKCCGYQ